MAVLGENFTQRFDTFINEFSDPRVKEWPLMETPLPVMSITAIYLYVILVWGRRFMASRTPFALQKPIQVINLMQIIINSWIVKEMIMAGWKEQNKSYWCPIMDYSRDPYAMRMARASWVFFIMKIVDLVDTLLFVLRKKDNQISVLHLYHHVSTLALGWITVKYAPGGCGTYIMFMNAVVHVLMYGYYFLTALGPNVRKFLWWKKYLTTLQMMQFCIGLTINVRNLRGECNYPRPLLILFVPLVSLNFILFMHFYVHAYTLKKKTK